MAEVDYPTCMSVSNSWDKIKQIPNHQEVVAEKIFYTMISMDTMARIAFPFIGLEERPDVSDNSKAQQHLLAIFDMLDHAIRFLGPDLEPLRVDMIELGKRHIGYGVDPMTLPYMTKAIIQTLDELLGDSFTEDDRKAWNNVLRIFCYFMRTGMDKAANSARGSERILLGPYSNH